MPKPVAVLDTNVLFPPTLRDTLIFAAEGGAFSLIWSRRILEELRRNLVGSGRVSAESAARRVHYMEQAFPCVEAALRDEEIPVLPDPGDRHVVGVAMEAGASIIVTQNLKHFPRAVLAPLGIIPMSADEFLMMLYGSAPDAMGAAIDGVVAQFRRPPVEHATFLAALAIHAPRFAHAATKRKAASGGPE